MAQGEEVADADTETPVDEEQIFFDRSEEGPISEDQNTDDVADKAAEFEQASQSEEPTQSDVESEVDQTEEQASQDEEPTQEEDQRYKHYQSKYDKAQSKLGFKPDEISQEEAEFYKALHNNPDVMDETIDILTSRIEGGNRQTSRQANSEDSQEKQGRLEPPKKPEKPADYNEYDALHDPESSSWKYRKAKERYQDKLIEYQNNRLQSWEEQQEQRRKQLQRQQQVQETKRQYAEFVQNEHGYDSQDAQDFVEFLTRENFDPDELVQMHKALTGKFQEDAQIRERERQVQDQDKQRESKAPSPGSAGGAGNRSGGDQFDDPEETIFGNFRS